MLPTTSRTIVAALAFCLAAPAAASAAETPATANTDVTRYAAVLRSINPALPLEAARKYATSVLADAWKTRLDPRFIMAIVTVESHWRSNAVSRVGARGLGQLMPSTARTLRVNAWDPTDNLRGTSRYLAALVHRFDGKPQAQNLAIAAYNAGPHAVQRYNGVPPFAETRTYVKRVTHVYHQLKGRLAAAHSAPAPLAAASVHPDETMWGVPARAAVPETVNAGGTTEPAVAAPAPAPGNAGEPLETNVPSSTQAP